jgi:hypothetical protein
MFAKNVAGYGVLCQNFTNPFGRLNCDEIAILSYRFLLRQVFCSDVCDREYIA